LKKTLQNLILIALAGVSLAPRAGATVYTIDPEHSSVVLNATHLGVGSVQGRFDTFSGKLEFDPQNVGRSRVHITIETASVNTNQPYRDEHLRSADFLDVSKYPEITFQSTGVTKVSQDEFRIAGNLSLHGTTRPVMLTAKLGGFAKDVTGKSRIAFSASTGIDRTDFGMGFNQMVAGTPLVGRIIQIFLNMEGVEQAGETPGQ
jgi:polyisoprenoid-binding protein YceI